MATSGNFREGEGIIYHPPVPGRATQTGTVVRAESGLAVRFDESGSVVPFDPDHMHAESGKAHCPRCGWEAEFRGGIEGV